MEVDGCLKNEHGNSGEWRVWRGAQVAVVVRLGVTA